MHTPPAQSELRRKLLLHMALKRQRRGTGSSYGFLHERSAMKTWPDFKSLLSGIDWAVIGAVATRLYMPERATADLDILIRTVDAKEAHKRLEAAEYNPEQQLAIPAWSWRSPDGTPIVLIETDEPWSQEALCAAKTNSDSQGLPVLPLPYLVLLKFRASRLQDLADVARMLGLASEEMRAQVRKLFTRHEPGGLEDLESLIHLGEREIR